MGKEAIECASFKDLQKIKDFVAQGGDVNAANHLGQTALHHAALAGDVETLQWLLDHGARPDMATIGGTTALHFAARSGSAECCDALLKSGASVDSRNILGRSPLWVAAERSHRTVAMKLLEGGAHVESEDLRGRTPLHMAIEKGDKALTEMLLSKGSSVIHTCEGMTGDDEELTPIDIARNMNRPDLCQTMEDIWSREPDEMKREEERAEERRAARKRDMRELFLAAWAGDCRAIDSLIGAGVDVNSQDTHGATALHEAVEHGHGACAEVLVQKKAKVNAKDCKGNTPLHIAAGALHVLTVETLLQCGASPNEHNMAGETPLHVVLQQHKSPMQKRAILQAATPRSNGRTKGGGGGGGSFGTAPSRAVMGDRRASVYSQLPLHDASSSSVYVATPGPGRTLGRRPSLAMPSPSIANAVSEVVSEHVRLGHAPRHLSQSAAALMSSSSASSSPNANAITGGWTLTKDPEEKNVERVVELLMKHGANVYERDWKGVTALQVAVEGGHLGSIETMLSSPAAGAGAAGAGATMAAGEDRLNMHRHALEAAQRVRNEELAGVIREWLEELREILATERSRSRGKVDAESTPDPTQAPSTPLAPTSSTIPNSSSPPTATPPATPASAGAGSAERPPKPSTPSRIPVPKKAVLSPPSLAPYWSSTAPSPHTASPTSAMKRTTSLPSSPSSASSTAASAATAKALHSSSCSPDAAAPTSSLQRAGQRLRRPVSLSVIANDSPPMPSRQSSLPALDEDVGLARSALVYSPDDMFSLTTTQVGTPRTPRTGGTAFRAGLSRDDILRARVSRRQSEPNLSTLCATLLSDEERSSATRLSSISEETRPSNKDDPSTLQKEVDHDRLQSRGQGEYNSSLPSPSTLASASASDCKANQECGCDSHTPLSAPSSESGRRSKLHWSSPVQAAQRIAAWISSPTGTKTESSAA
mmetsp:Transcript_21730/g.35932  ORF Transcript_21730/g.35932 Transcript_21730/m.35932 type:complete len:937 (-) Transcript_21730:88-2898(-)